jgi:hypothetical protein
MMKYLRNWLLAIGLVLVPSFVLADITGGLGPGLSNIFGALGLAHQTFYVSDLPGVVGDGVTDDTVGLNTALTTATGGILYLSASHHYLINSANLTIPANTQLACPAGITRQTVSSQNPRTLPCALLVNGSFTVNMAANGAALTNVPVVNSALTLPSTAQQAVTAVAAFAGTGITIATSEVDINHVFIIGFATCISSSHGARTNMYYVYGDCTAGIVQDNVHDISRIDNAEIFPFLTGSQTWETQSLTVSGAADNGAGLIRVTLSAPMSPTLVTGNVVSIQGVGGFTGANGQWTITVVDSTHIDLQGSHSTPPTITGTDTNGNLVIQALSSVADLATGQNITGTGIPASTTIAAFSPYTGELVLSVLATSTNVATTLTITNSAYTSGGTVVLDTDARTGDAFKFTNSETLSCVSCFEYDHTVGFRVGTAAKWTKLINPDADGQNVARNPNGIAFLVEGTSVDTQILGASAQSYYNGLMVNSSGAGVTKATGLTLNGYTNSYGIAVIQGGLEISDTSGTAAGSLFFDSTGTTHFMDSNVSTSPVYMGPSSILTLRMANVVSGSTGTGAGLVTYGMTNGPNNGLVFAGSSANDHDQGAQFVLNNTTTSATTPIKYIRVSFAGTLDFMNNAYARMGRFLDDGHFNSTLPYFQTASAPTVSACGSTPNGSVDANSSPTGGTVTIGGSSPASCTITFAVAFVNWNHCVLSFENGTAKPYSYTKSVITITGSPTSAGLVDYKCDGD